MPRTPTTRRTPPQRGPSKPEARKPTTVEFPPPGWLYIVSKSPALRVMARWGDDSPTVTGDPRWSVHERPGRVSLTTYDGQDPYRMTLPILLDGWQDNRDVGPFMSNLWRMARFTAAGKGDPPKLRVFRSSGNLGPEVEWVIESLDVGDVLWGDSGVLLRADVTVNLLEYVESKSLRTLADANIAREAKEAEEGGAGERYTVKKGDTLQSIAAKKLGKASRAREIAKLNRIRDLTKDLKPGTVLRLPAK